MINNIKNFSKEIRKAILKIVFETKSSHVGSALSMVDILAVLYSGILKINPKDPKDENRDIFLLSKGHACTGLYATLAFKKFFPVDDLDTFAKNNSLFLSHTSHKIPGIELSTGSLGHALSVACGFCYSFKTRSKSNRVYCLLSDGELDEGSNWEAILFAGHHKLHNLIVIVDHNKIQSFGTIKEVLDLGSLKEKFESFGFSVYEINGHNHKMIYDTFVKAKLKKTKPTVIIANTIKGKGVNFMENKLEWHYKSPSEEQYRDAINQIELQ